MKFVSDCSLSDTINRLKNKTITPENLIEDLCEKLETWDTKIKSFLPEKNRRWRLHKDLGQLYNRFPDTEKRPVLFGVPIGVKDIFNINGFETKAGSELPSKEFSGEEAEVVTELKKSGALILGKTVTTEFAYFHPSATCNPNNFDRTPGGSSSGSAAAVAAGFCPLALGTQTVGSITRPASFCGTFGFKPSFGRISTKGVIPFSPSADHIGFFSQDLQGAEVVASILCNEWYGQIKEITSKQVFGVPEGKYLKQTSLEMLNAFNKVINNLKNAGLRIKYIPALENIDEITAQHNIMIAAEFAKSHQNLYGKYKNLYHPASSELYDKGLKISELQIQQAIQGRTIERSKMENLLAENEIDILITPSTLSTAPLGLHNTGDPAMNLPWTYLGLPTLSIPFGFIDDLPFGLQFIGRYYQDESLFNLDKKLVCTKNRF
ncbi:MAG: amidase [Candidatus Cloacimonetes bacterium]|nr:amidase [Candidatus Cloacimonadota bacterium]